MECGLHIASTRFKHKITQKTTWISPNHKYENQIDHVLITKKRQSLIRDVKTLREPDVDSDHFMVMALLQHKQYSKRNKIEKLRLCRNLIGCKKYISRLKEMDAREMIRYLYKKDICKCTACGGKMITVSPNRYYIKKKGYMRC